MLFRNLISSTGIVFQNAFMNCVYKAIHEICDVGMFLEVRSNNINKTDLRVSIAHLKPQNRY